MTGQTLTPEQQRELAKAISRATQWHKGVGWCVAEDIDKAFKGSCVKQLMGEIDQEVRYEYHGALRDEKTESARLNSLLYSGYRLCNYKPGEISIHAPDSQGGGIAHPGYVVGEWADRLGPFYDPHNYEVHKSRGDI